MKLKPKILCHPNIPKPLHGVAPRVIMGEQWWDNIRHQVYASTNYCCSACGVHKSQAKEYQHLEAHEFWEIDYRTGICKIHSIEPLCHFCHNFIHSGRLSMIEGKEKSRTEVMLILMHGLKILSENNLKCFPPTLDYAESLGCYTFGVEKYSIPKSNVPWDKWKLVWEGKEYYSKFKNMDEWSNNYK